MYERHQLVDKTIHIIGFLHDDGTKTHITLIPHPDGLSLNLQLGAGKVLHDLVINRQHDEPSEVIEE